MRFASIARKYRKIFSAGLLAATILAAIGCVAADREAEEGSAEQVYLPEVRTEIVRSGISQEIATTGEVRAAKSATLTAEIRSEVKKVLVKVGDEVYAGQILAQLSSDSVASTRSTAGAAFVNAQSSLAQTELSSDQSIESARVALQTAEINLETTLKQNEALLRQAEEVLNAAKLSSGLSVSAAETTLDNAVRSAYPAAKDTVAECDEIVGVSSAYESSNDSFEHLIGALQSSSKPLAEAAIQNALNFLNYSADDYSSALALLEAAEGAAAATLDVLNNSITGADFTQTTLNSDIAAITAELSSIRSAISTLESAQSALESAQQSTDGNSQAVLSAQAVYAATIAQLAANEEAARRSVAATQAALESASKSAELTRTSAKASLNAVAGNLSQAQISQSKLTIRAPFAGKITSIEVEPGDEAAAGSNLIRIEDASLLKIVAYLSASAVRKIQPGDEVRIATKSSDRISAISPSADPATKKFTVEILHQNPYLQPGEFVKLRFQIGEQDSADTRIFLPINSINILSYGSFVWKLTPQLTEGINSKAVKQAVQLGEIEGEFVEITDGLAVGEEVIIDGGRILDASAEEVEVEINK
ncbi:efflux RND transporter periplasmic adaptor subunit [Patescibacteria group bacterium]|nr:efflux RND transporter periplasmic adaptor subunit [Patescibacteria group bacterium]